MKGRPVSVNKTPLNSQEWLALDFESRHFSSKEEVGLLVKLHHNIELATHRRYAAVNAMVLPFLRYGHLAMLATSFCRWRVEVATMKTQELFQRAMRANQIIMRHAGSALLQARTFSLRVLQRISSRQMKPIFERWRRQSYRARELSGEQLELIEERILAKHGIKVINIKAQSREEAQRKRRILHAPVLVEIEPFPPKSQEKMVIEAAAKAEQERQTLAMEAEERTRLELELAVEMLGRGRLRTARKMSELLTPTLDFAGA
jgi:hypothetical protein